MIVFNIIAHLVLDYFQSNTYKDKAHNELYNNPMTNNELVGYVENIEDYYVRTTEPNHPSCSLNENDIIRAHKNIERHQWASKRANSLISIANYYVRMFNDTFIHNMILPNTPTARTFCPHCVKQKFNWHPNGNWKWTIENPDSIKCNVCGTIFPNSEYPESIQIRSEYDPSQVFTYIDGEIVKCMGYKYCLSSINRVIYGNKVQYMIDSLSALSQGYVLSNNATYALYVKKILIRLADVFPKYLVSSGYSYGEVADCDPHIAIRNLSALPTKKIAAPPNARTKALYAGYWSSSRLGTSGMDGVYVTKLADAYDLVFKAHYHNNTPMFSQSEKLHIENDLLIESALLAIYDKPINNKSVGNRAGAAFVGLVCGIAKFVEFGLEGFYETLKTMFLPDGGSLESSAYGFMTMSGIFGYGYAFRNFSSSDNKSININKVMNFDECWQALELTSRENLQYPALGDSYVTTSLSSVFAEYTSMAFPQSHRMSLLVEKTKGSIPSPSALFYRDINFNESNINPLSLPNIVFPYYKQGFLRTGPLGRNSTCILQGADYNSHHHNDALNLYYSKDGRELLNDLGYLWDHVNASFTKRTRAHNLVMIDNKEQITKGTKGSFHMFSHIKNVKCMQASSNPYEKTSIYNRTVIQVEHGDSNYILDIFRADGGELREYVFHGPNQNYSYDSNLRSYIEVDPQNVWFGVMLRLDKIGYIDLTDVTLQEVFPNGSFGNTMLQSIPDTVSSSCPKNNNWCYYAGNGKAEWSIIDTPYGKGIRLNATQEQDGRVNVALIIGNSNGYTGTNSLKGKLGHSYKLSYKMRGSKSISSMVVYWINGTENNPLSRLFTPLSYVNQPPTNSTWQIYEGMVIIDTFYQSFLNSSYSPKPWSITWRIDHSYSFTTFLPGGENELVLINDDWGQRFYDNSDYGIKLPYISVFKKKEKVSTFVSVFEGYFNENKHVNRVETMDLGQGNVLITVHTTKGDDVFISSFNSSLISHNNITTDASIAFKTCDGKYGMIGGTQYYYLDHMLFNDMSQYSGNIIGSINHECDSYFVIDKFVHSSHLLNQTIFVSSNDEIEHAYPIMDFQNIVTDQTIIFTRKGCYGFRVHNETLWRIPSISEQEISNFNTIEPTPIYTLDNTPLITFEQTPIKSYERTYTQTIGQTPMISLEQTPLISLEPTPMISLEQTPMLSFEQTPIRSSEQTPMMSFEQTPLMSSEQTPIRSLEPTPLISLEQTPMMSLEQTPLMSLEQTPMMSFEQTPLMSSEQTPMMSSEQTPIRSSEQTPMMSFEQTPLMSFEQTPLMSSEQTPIRSSEQTPIRSSEQTPLMSFEQTPLMSSEQTPIRSSEQTPMMSFEQTPLMSFEQTPLMSFEQTPLMSSEQTPMMSLEQTPMISIEQSPIRSLEPTPLISLEQTQRMSLEQTPMISLEPTPIRSLEPTPIRSLEPTQRMSLEQTPLMSFEPTPMISLEPTQRMSFEQTPMISLEPTPIRSLEPTQRMSLEQTPMISLEPTQRMSFEQTPFNSLDYSIINTINETYVITFTELSTQMQIILNLLGVTLMIVLLFLIIFVIFHFLNPKVDSSEQSLSCANEMWD